MQGIMPSEALSGCCEAYSAIHCYLVRLRDGATWVVTARDMVDAWARVIIEHYTEDGRTEITNEICTRYSDLIEYICYHCENSIVVEGSVIPSHIVHAILEKKIERTTIRNADASELSDFEWEIKREYPERFQDVIVKHD